MKRHVTRVAGLFGGRSEKRYKGTGGGTTTTTNEPWSGAKPYLTQGYQAAGRNILDRPTEFFPDSTVTPYSQETEAALGAQTNRAQAGSPLLRQSQGYTSDVLSGKAFAPGSPLMQGIASSVRPGVDSSFARAGRGGSPLHTEALSRGMMAAMAPYMESAASRAPGLAQADYADIDRLSQVGAARESKAAQELADKRERFDFAQNEPAQRTQAYNNIIAGLPSFGSSTSTSRNNTNIPLWLLGTATQAAGGAATGGLTGGK